MQPRIDFNNKFEAEWPNSVLWSIYVCKYIVNIQVHQREKKWWYLLMIWTCQNWTPMALSHPSSCCDNTKISEDSTTEKSFSGSRSKYIIHYYSMYVCMHFAHFVCVWLGCDNLCCVCSSRWWTKPCDPSIPATLCHFLPRPSCWDIPHCHLHSMLYTSTLYYIRTILKWDFLSPKACNKEAFLISWGIAHDCIFNRPSQKDSLPSFHNQSRMQQSP